MSGDDLTYVTVEMAKPRNRDNFPGRIEEGFYAVEGDTVFLYDMNGERIAREKIPPALSPGQQAARMLKARAGNKASDFGRKLQYPAGY